jgi:phytoene dehydrogenase-like protein
MTTLVEDLKRSIAQLEEEAPSSRLLKDFREQLAAIEYSDGKTAEQLYYSGNPVVPTCPPVTDDPMLPPGKQTTPKPEEVAPKDQGEEEEK